MKRGLPILPAALLLTACAHQAPVEQPPSVAPDSQPPVSLRVDGAEIRPMYREVLPVDLPTVSRVAAAQNIDIRQAQERVLAARGGYESSVEALFPVIAPGILFQHLDGANQNANGSLVVTNFNNILPSITLQWILNPGRVYYDIVASKRRLEASGQQERAVVLDTARTAAIQYYDLVRAQAGVASARLAERHAAESLRLVDVRVKAGDALPADLLRVRASLAARREDLLLAVNAFYQSSLSLTLTLHLDPLVTLVPAADELSQTTLVREDLSIDQLLAIAVTHRPDLQAARTLLAAADADKGGTIWGALGPQLRAAYSFGSFKTDARGQTFGPDATQRGYADAAATLSLQTLGQAKTADANIRSAALDVERRLDQVRAQVVSSQQDALANGGIIPIAREELDSAAEALRLAQADLKAGTMLLIDVLQSESAQAAAQHHYADAVARYNQAQINLLAALGLLNEQTLCPGSQPVAVSARQPGPPVTQNPSAPRGQPSATVAARQAP
jgi:outer membrane protein TolC